MNFFTFTRAFWKLYKEIQKQRKYNDSFLVSYIKELENRYNGRFSEEQLKKIAYYYGLFIPSVLCASYKRLYNEPFSNEERKRAALFGILTPVGDDLFDIDKLDEQAIKNITYSPETYVANSFSAAVAKEIQAFLLEDVPHKDDYLQAAKNVFEIQLETKKQTSHSITDEELKRITYAKGGYSVIIYHSILNNKASAEMTQALFNIGSLMQLTNDIFDMHKDLRDSIITLPDRCGDFGNLKKIFIEKVKETNKSIYSLPFKKRDKEEFSIIVNFIISRGLVALDQMIKLEEKFGKPLRMSQLSRKQIICDMQKVKNILRWLFYIYRVPKLK